MALSVGWRRLDCALRPAHRAETLLFHREWDSVCRPRQGAASRSASGSGLARARRLSVAEVVVPGTLAADGTCGARERELLDALLPFDAVQFQLKFKVGFRRFERTHGGDIPGRQFVMAETKTSLGQRRFRRDADSEGRNATDSDNGTPEDPSPVQVHLHALPIQLDCCGSRGLRPVGCELVPVPRDCVHFGK